MQLSAAQGKPMELSKQSLTPAENELVEKLAKTLHRFLCAARNIEWEAGDTCDDCKDDIQKVLLPIIREYANALVGAAYAVAAEHVPGVYMVFCKCGWRSTEVNQWREHIRSLPPEATAKELEAVKLRAKLEGLKAARQRTFPGHRVLVNLGHDPSAVRAVEWLRMDIEGEIEDAERQLVALSKQPVAKETT